MTPLLNAPGQPVWLAGFHSGALVAMEMANHYPEQVSGLVLVDVPVFSGPDMAELRGSLTTPPKYLEQEDPLNGLFKAMVADRLDKVAYPRALDLFFDFVGAGESRNAGYHAAANFEAEPAATKVAQPALVIATHSSLRDGTLQVAEWLPQATLVERDDITMPAFELGAEPIAELTRFRWLDDLAPFIAIAPSHARFDQMSAGPIASPALGRSCDQDSGSKIIEEMTQCAFDAASVTWGTAGLLWKLRGFRQHNFVY